MCYFYNVYTLKIYVGNVEKKKENTSKHTYRITKWFKPFSIDSDECLNECLFAIECCGK